MIESVGPRWRSSLWGLALAVALGCSPVPRVRVAQAVSLTQVVEAPKEAPADATGRCGDGGYTVAATSLGACSQHGGLQSWWGLRTDRLLRPPLASVASAPQSHRAPVGVDTRPIQQEAPRAATTDSVWINTRSMIYHCSGSRYFGRTAQGRFVREVEAIEAGARAAYNRACSETSQQPVRARPN